MSRYLSLDEFRQRFEVVPPDSLSAHGSSTHGSFDLTAREPTKYADPFVGREEGH